MFLKYHINHLDQRKGSNFLISNLKLMPCIAFVCILYFFFWQFKDINDYQKEEIQTPIKTTKWENLYLVFLLIHISFFSVWWCGMGITRMQNFALGDYLVRILIYPLWICILFSSSNLILLFSTLIKVAFRVNEL